MNTADLPARLLSLEHSDPLIRESTCEAVRTGDDLSLVAPLIVVITNDPNVHVRHDAAAALVRLCFARPVDPDESPRWWHEWWTKHKRLSSEELLSMSITRYLFHLANNHEELADDEITLNLAFDTVRMTWPTHSEAHSSMAQALLAVLGTECPTATKDTATHTTDNTMKAIASRLTPFCRHFLSSLNDESET